MMHSCFLCKQTYESNYYWSSCPDCHIEIGNSTHPTFETNGFVTHLILQYEKDFYKITFGKFNSTRIYKATILHFETTNYPHWILMINLPYILPLTTNLPFILALA